LCGFGRNVAEEEEGARGKVERFYIILSTICTFGARDFVYSEEFSPNVFFRRMRVGGRMEIIDSLFWWIAWAEERVV
jgi:hypothetical protein